VEHWDKRKTTIILQSVMSIQAFGLAFLTLTGHIQIWHIVALAFFYGTAVAVEVTARQAMLIELVGKESLPNAIALQTTAFNLGRVLGPLTAAWLMSTTGGEASVFFVNGLSFIFVVVGLLFARTRFKVEKDAKEEQSMGGEFKEGIQYIRTNFAVMSVILMSSLLGFFGIPLLQQIPALARDVLMPILSSETLIAARTSELYAAQGAGAVLAALLAASLHSMDKQKMLFAGQVGFLIPIIWLALIRDVNISLVLLFFIGWGTITQLVMMNTMIQIQVPNELRGRVFSIYFWALQGVAPFGSIFVGWIAQSWGVPTSMIIGGVICLIGTGAIRLYYRDLSIKTG
jgi:MFS family permease